MTTIELLTSAWDWKPVPLAAAVLATVATAAAIWLRPKSSALWVGALVFTLLATVSPLATLSAGVLFTAHMAQHLILLLIIPLFIILALRPKPGAAARKPSVILGWAAGVGMMWLWHEPTLCSLSVISPGAQAAQIVTLIVGGYLFWRPVWGSARLGAGGAISYLFSACLACTALGVYITFVPLSVCPVFREASTAMPALSLVRNGWGFSAAADQQLGGLFMWVPSCLIYLASILAQFARWHRPAPALTTIHSA